MAERLPKSLLDLIEHIELNKSGWWDAALSNVLLAATWMQGTPVHPGQVRDLIVSAFNLEIPPDRIATHIDRLLRDGSLAILDNGHIVPTDSIAEQMERRLEAALQNEDKVRVIFDNHVGKCCAPYSPEEAWSLFTEKYFLPLIDVLGARTLQFMGGDTARDADAVSLTDEFVKLFDVPHRAELRSAIASFLDPNDMNVRRYVTEHLDASFLVRASGLTTKAIAGISKLGQRPPAFRLFLDTNFLFSLLDLHENPSNEETQMLGQMVHQVGEHFSIRMYVIQPTMDEIKRVLWAAQVDLSEMRMSPALADAALDVGLSGVAIRFARANRESVRPITAREYFDPYLNNLTPILKSKNVQVYNERTDRYRQRQDVIDDVHDMVASEGETEGERQRRYNAGLHDSILWHFVHDKRPAVFESPLEANFWVVTNDYRLINFDKRRRNDTNSSAGVCIHPTELVQILRLWEPRSTDIEQALMSTLRLPFMFYEFNSGQEAASMHVLKALSRFEHIEFLGPDAIRDIVLNDNVRSKIMSATSDEEQIEVIRDVLLAERQEIVAQRDEAIRQRILVEESLTNVEETLIRDHETAQNNDTLDTDKRAQEDRRIAELESELQDARAEARTRGEQVKELSAVQSQKDEHNRIRSVRIRTALTRGVAGGILSAAIAAGLGTAWVVLEETHLWIVSLSMLIVWIASWFLILTTRVQDTDVSTSATMLRLLNLRRQATLLLGPLCLAVLGNAIWEFLIRPIWFG